jgi:hypothetical protein
MRMSKESHARREQPDDVCLQERSSTVNSETGE